MRDQPEKQKTILLVEDETVIAMIEEQTLKSHGFNVIIASSGEKAINIVKNTPDIDLILMDINLGKGKMDGTVAAEIILKERDIPVLFLSSYTQAEVVQKTERITSYGYVVKDSGETVLITSIKMAFKLSDAHQRLKESETRFRRISTMTSDITYSCRTENDGRFSIAWMTGAADSITGYSSEEIKAQGCWRFMVIEEDIALFEENVIALAPGSRGSCELRIRHKNGDVVWISSFAECVSETQLPGCLLLYGGLVDITARKQLEKALLESETHYRSLVEGIPGIVYSFSSKRGGVYYSSHVTNLLGYSPEQLCAQPLLWHNSIHPDDLLRIEQVIRETAAGNPFRVEYRIRDAHGNWHWFDDLSFGYQMDGTDTIIDGLALDITVRKQAEKKLQDTLESLRKAFGTTIQVMVSAVETRDPYTAGHQNRSADLARAIAAEMGLSQERIEGIRMAGSIHDIGKLSVPAEILAKPTKLPELELRLIKEHAQKGFEMLKDVESPWPLAEMVYQHHERMDGSGYPRHLKGEEIIMEARILAIADVVESMASHRPYRPALGLNAALEEIENNKGTIYDADAVNACLSLFREKGYKLE